MFITTLRRLPATALLPIIFALAVSLAFADGPGVVLQGKQGPLAGKHIVLVAGDDEYRSEELIPQLGRILAVRHGCRATVLFAVDRNTGFIDPPAQNIPGLESLDSAGREKADLLVIFTRFRELPDEQMKHLADYIESGRPIIGLRTATHAFNYTSLAKAGRRVVGGEINGTGARLARTPNTASTTSLFPAALAGKCWAKRGSTTTAYITRRAHGRRSHPAGWETRSSAA